LDIRHLNQEDSATLLALPESGMGYQIIASGEDLFIVFNVSTVLDLSEFLEGNFSEADYDYLSGDPDFLAEGNLRSFDVGKKFELVFSDFDTDFERSDIPFKHNPNAIPPRTIRAKRVPPFSYYRFSAYFKDKRVNAQGFKPGAYATTYNDLHFVPSGFAAVGRYAIPNPASARFVFQIVTFDRPDLMATATPNNVQAGGGVEVYFKNSARNIPDASFPISIG
jgi:hypothetical protein